MKLKRGSLVRDKYLGDRFGIVLETVKGLAKVYVLGSKMVLNLYIEDLEVVNV